MKWILSLILIISLATLPFFIECRNDDNDQNGFISNTGTSAPLLPEHFHCDFYVSELNCGDKRSMRIMAEGQFYFDSVKKMNAYLIDTVPEHERARIVLYKNVYYMIDEGTGKCRSVHMPKDYHPVSRDFLRKNFQLARTSWVNREYAFLQSQEWTYNPYRVKDEAHMYKYIHDISKNTPFRFQHPLSSQTPHGVMVTDFKNFHVGFDNVDEHGWLFQIPDDCPEVDLASELGLWNRGGAGGGYYGAKTPQDTVSEESSDACSDELYRMMFEQYNNRDVDQEYLLMHPLMLKFIESSQK